LKCFQGVVQKNYVCHYFLDLSDMPQANLDVVFEMFYNKI